MNLFQKINKYLLIIAILSSGGLCAQGVTRTLAMSDTTKDYGPVISKVLKDIVAAGGGTLKIPYGKYPLLTSARVDNKGKVPKIAIVGIKNSKGKLPIFQDTDTTRLPHNFFTFVGNSRNPSIVISIMNLEIIGNNVPYTATHPFYGKANAVYAQAISGLNVFSFIIDNVTIRNFYGRGIMLANYHDPHYNKEYRIESAVVKNSKILNVWGWSKKDDSGDGIEFYSANKPVVENNTILNNLSYSKFVGRSGVVLEHNTENGIVRNNKIGGYQRNIHIECDWGGHLIEKNAFTQSSIAVTLSEDCAQPKELSNSFSPIIIRDNTMSYAQEFKKYNIAKGDYAFISVHRPNVMLNGLQIVNNKMIYAIDKKLDQTKTNKRILEKNKNIYIELRGQPNVTVKGNVLD